MLWIDYSFQVLWFNTIFTLVPIIVVGKNQASFLKQISFEFFHGDFEPQLGLRIKRLKTTTTQKFFDRKRPFLLK